MPEGGCLCGNVRISYSGEPVLVAVCHCGDCRKISGSAFSTNVLVPEKNLIQLRGTPKVFEKIGDHSGLPIRSYFCGDCGSTCYREGQAFPGVKIVKAGVLDHLDVEPAMESWADTRVDWLPSFGGSTAGACSEGDLRILSQGLGTGDNFGIS